MRAWLVYNKEDYKKNIYFSQQLIAHGKEQGLQIELVLRENLLLGIAQNNLSIKRNPLEGSGQLVQQQELPEIVINRSRDSFLAKQLELMHIKVYNSYAVTYHCNHKGLTHQLVGQLGVPTINTLFGDKAYFNSEQATFSYPLVLKSASGHGGSQVFCCKDKEDLKHQLKVLKDNHFLIQEVCDNPGIDVRVFVMGKHILGAIKRESKEDFRSNYCLGGEASLFELTKEQKEMVKKVMRLLDFDFVGIDFLIDQKGQFLFNEIEDVVGSRSLYANTSIDVAKCYIKHIIETSTYLWLE